MNIDKDVLMRDSELVEKIKNNDYTAFKTFYELYKNLAYNVCYRILNNNEDADDATQEVFIKAFKSIRKFRGEAKLSTWLYQIAVNTSLNYVRRKKIVSFLSLDYLIREENRFSDNSRNRPDLELEKNESEMLVQNAIRDRKSVV